VLRTSNAVERLHTSGEVRDAEALLRLVIVIVNWNSGDQLATCMRSLLSMSRPDHLELEVIIVDNGSVDGSTTFLEGPPVDKGVHLLCCEANLGFARACNVGFEDAARRKGVPDFVLFLNPDTVLGNRTLVRLFEHRDLRDRRFGIFGVRMVDDDGIATSCSNFPTVSNFLLKLTGFDALLPGVGLLHHHLRNFDHRTDRTVDQVLGAFFLVRGGLFNRLAGFDPQFFVYFEEVDFALRASKAGILSRYLAEPTIYHKGQGTTDQVRPFRQYLSVSSRLRYFRKHHGRAGFWAILLASYVVEMPLRMAQSVARRRWREALQLIPAYARALKDLALRRKTEGRRNSFAAAQRTTAIAGKRRK
jgi:N-acetylglucosaminyl-diphospho-decaprenol L-rhamnosyltransferase